MTEVHDPSHFAFDSFSDFDQTRLAEILDEYLIAHEEGRAISVDDLVAKHPDLEQPLRQYLSGLDLIQEISGQKSVEKHPELQGDCSLTDYELGDEIGRGGMGVVYSAVEIKSGREVAIKVLPFGSFVNDEDVARFLREARVGEAIRHANLVPVYEVGCDAGVHFYSMQKINGSSLDELLESGRILKRQGAASDSILFSEDRYKDLALGFAAVAEALEVVHQAGVVHRDIKPSNLILDQNEKLWLTDFGLVRDNFDQSLTNSDAVLGTLKYMSPEQARGENEHIGPTADIYSLGATLFEVVTLRPIYRVRDVTKLLLKIEQNKEQVPTHWNPNIPHDLETIILRAIKLERGERYQSAADFAADLKRFANGEPIQARRVSLAQQATAFSRKHQSKIWQAIALCLLCILGVWVVMNVASPKASLVSNRITSPVPLADVELTLKQLAQSRKHTPKVDQSYRKLIASLEDHKGQIDQVFWFAIALNQYSSKSIKSGDVNTAENAALRALQLESLYPNAKRFAYLKLLTRSNLISIGSLKSETPLDATTQTDSVVASIKEIAESDPPPDAIDVANRLVPSLLAASRKLAQQGRLSDGLSVAESAETLVQRLHAQGEVSSLQLANVCGNVGVLQYASGDFTSSKQSLQKGVQILRIARQQEPENLEIPRVLVNFLDYLGLANIELLQYQDAHEAYDEAMTLVQNLTLFFYASDVGALEQAAIIFNNGARLAKLQNRHEDTKRLTKQAIEFLKKAIAIEPSDNLKQRLAQMEKNLNQISSTRLAAEEMHG